MIGTVPLALASGVFTLSWTHSVEKTGWEERWRVAGAVLVLEEARVKGSGAGMEPGAGARLEGGWWVWDVGLTVPEAVLALSGATGGDWRLCADGVCRGLTPELGASVVLRGCGG